MKIPWLALVVGLCAAGNPATAEQWLYFDAFNMMRMHVDGTHLETIALGIPHCFFRSVAVDQRTDRVYFVESCTLPTGAIIYRWDSKTGSQWFFSGPADVGGIAVDSVAGAVYFNLRVDGGEIDRKYLGADGWEPVVRNAGRDIWGIAIDPAAGRLYWTTSDSGDPPVGRIRRANLDGSNVEDFVVGLAIPREVAVDPGGGKIYWADEFNRKIQRADLADGANVESIVPEGIDAVFGITLDVSAGKIYWADSGLQKIRRANLDGSHVEDVLSGIAALAIEIGPDRVVPLRPGSWSEMKGFFR